MHQTIQQWNFWTFGYVYIQISFDRTDSLKLDGHRKFMWCTRECEV